MIWHYFWECCRNGVMLNGDVKVYVTMWWDVLTIVLGCEWIGVGDVDLSRIVGWIEDGEYVW